MPRHTAAITREEARAILGDSILTEAPRIAPRACSKPRCTACDRPARLDRNGLCRPCR